MELKPVFMETVHNMAIRTHTQTQRKNYPCACHEAYRGSRGIDPVILNRSTRQRCVVNFTPQMLHPWAKTLEPT